MLIKISVCNRRTDKKYKNKELEWDYIIDRNRNPIRTSETAEEYSKLPKAKRGELKDIGVLVILFGKGNAPHLDDLFASGADAIGVDWTVTLEDAARRANGRVALQGNLDPAVLLATPEAVVREATRVLDAYGPGDTGHVFNLGHGISQFTPPDNVAALVETVHAYRRQGV